MSVYTNITNCRVCGSDSLTEVIGLGEQYFASNFVETNEGHPYADTKVPETVMLCGGCGLLQMKETVDRGVLYRDYFYRSGTNPMMRAALKDVVKSINGTIKLVKDDYVLDVGSNDCTMLSYYPSNLNRFGIEPATNISWDGLDKSITVINDYFNKEKIDAATDGAKFRVITSIAMLYGVEDLNGFAQSVKSMLTPDGIWCIQLSYVPELIKTLSFYDICHEHLYYFSLETLNYTLERNGLSIYDASTNDVNGGSLRVFVTHIESRSDKTIDFYKLFYEEKKMRLNEPEVYQMFYRNICDLKQKVTDHIRQENDDGNLVVGLGGSTKGNVLLQFFELNKTLLPYISDRNPEKVGLRTLGTDFEIISEERARELKPSCMLVLIWFFKEEIIQREYEYLKAGGQLLFPMPYAHLVTIEGEKAL